MANPNPVHKFQPGVVTNPNGAPKKELAMTEALKDLLLIKDPIKKIEHYKLLLEKALQLAMRGDGDMIKYLVNRIDGMPKGSDTNIAVAVQNITYSPEDRLSVAYELVAKENNLTIEQLKEKL